MNTRKMSTETMRRLEGMGWYFFPSGPNEYEWMKFRGDDRVARGGDETWFRDLAEAERPETIKPW